MTESCIDTVLIANRGEIALRAVNTCRALGLRSVAVYSTADATSPHVTAADTAICIGPPSATLSYLSVPALLHAAIHTGCNAIYPGYGFLSENADFARKCEDNGIKFIGPSADTIATMGDKAKARETAAQLGVPVVPGSDNAFTRDDEAFAVADNIGYPLLLKARAGGGGRGMRVVESSGQFVNAFSQASREAESAFCDGAMYMERFLPRIRHIEVQVLGDGLGHAVAFDERDCSVQRRHQKLVEESPSPVVDAALRTQLLQAALSLTRGINYTGAGTVEFILDVESKAFYFIEMNTRIQVEHPVTELRTGIDLVAAQFQIAAGEGLSSFERSDIQQGHAIEFRINAENWHSDFQPSPGLIHAWEVPRGEGIRLDTAVSVNQMVTPYYDSMIAKLIVHGTDRMDAIDRARAALAAFHCGGIATTIDFHRFLIEHDDYMNNNIHTRWIEDVLLADEPVRLSV